MRKAFFLDRDGVINEVRVVGKTTEPPHNVLELLLKKNILPVCISLKEKGFLLIIISNQPDVARGKQKRELVEGINNEIASQLPIDDFFVCYHDDHDNCSCRKPKPGLLLEAAVKYDLSLKDSFFLGDRWSDIVAGESAGCTTILLQNEYSGSEKCTPDYVIETLDDVMWVIQNNQQEKNEN